MRVQLLCSIGPGLAGWNGYGKGRGQQQSSRSDYSFRTNHTGTGFGASGEGAWPDSSYTWEAGYVAGLEKMGGKKNRKKKPASSSDVTPESTPEKPKNKQWRKVNSAISSQKSNKQKPREPRSKDWPNWSTGSHPVHAAQQFSAAPSKATEGDGGPICKVQQKLAARMLDVVVLALFLLFSVPRQKN